jgi:hypothetical protein
MSADFPLIALLVTPVIGDFSSERLLFLAFLVSDT